MTKESRIFLVRHGEAAASWAQSADPGLSALGQQQAQDTADALHSSLNSGAATVATPLISSPLARAQETAAPLARHLGCAVDIDTRFREIPSPVPLSERQDWLRAFMRGCWSDHDREGELQRWRQRLIEGIRGLPDNSIVFTHFLVINSIVGHSQGNDKTLVCWPANASVTTLLHDRQSTRVEALGAQMQTVVN